VIKKIKIKDNIVLPIPIFTDPIKVLARGTAKNQKVTGEVTPPVDKARIQIIIQAMAMEIVTVRSRFFVFFNRYGREKYKMDPIKITRVVLDFSVPSAKTLAKNINRAKKDIIKFTPMMRWAFLRSSKFLGLLRSKNSVGTK
jgi:hypothetical protein